MRTILMKSTLAFINELAVQGKPEGIQFFAEKEKMQIAEEYEKYLILTDSSTDNPQTPK